MERESFEDEEVARVLNERFVPIKVDREERPDVDAVYMSAVQALTGGGGWPMTVWLTPDRKPFHGGTYFPAPAGGRGGRGLLLSRAVRRHSRGRLRRSQVPEQPARPLPAAPAPEDAGRGRASHGHPHSREDGRRRDGRPRRR